jgi:hypothetical protein
MGLSLDQASELEHVGDTLYIGFNDDLERVSFPKLKTVGGALIIEANAVLKEIHLPCLERVTKYLHIHDNAAVAVVELPRLKEVGGELSFETCPSLKAVRVASASAPAKASSYAVKGCGMPVFPGAHIKTG